MVEIRTDELKRAETKIREDQADLHISGEPGIGKSKFLTHLQSRVENDFCLVEQTVRLHHDQNDLVSNILHDARREAPRRDNLPNKITGASGGIAGVSAGVTTDQRATDFHKLEDLTEDWSGKPIIICIDDIHKISDDKHVVRDAIREISSYLGNNAQLVTIGQITLPGNSEIEIFHLNLFTYNETKQFLESKFGEIDEETAKVVHNSIEGHPLYLSLLTESSDEESDLHLPENEIYDTIQHRYLKTLPAETEEFLRKVAPLPELNEKNVNSALSDYSSTQIDRRLRDLNSQVIVQEVNRTNQGRKIYKIHEIFREYLNQKETDAEEIHRTAFKYHVNEMVDIVTRNDEETVERSLPHSFNANYHLNQLYDEVDSETLFREFEKLDVEYPKRGMMLAVSGLLIVPLDAAELFRLEHENFSEWILDQTDEHPLAKLTVQVTNWGLSQFEEEPIDLSEIQVEGDLDEIPTESQPFADVELSETHAERLNSSINNLLAYFFIDEPFQSESFRQQLEQQIELYGISTEILIDLQKQIKLELRESVLEDEFESILEDYFDTLGQKYNNQLMSNLDFYELSDLSMQFGHDVFDEIHEDLLLESGVLENIALEGGDVLEDAENPAFSLVWYSVWISYFKGHPIEESRMDELIDEFDEALSSRREFENEAEEPILSADAVSEDLELSEEN